VVFRARLSGLAELENLLPGFGTDRKVSIDDRRERAEHSRAPTST
jgi:hypothetical protein